MRSFFSFSANIATFFSSRKLSRELLTHCVYVFYYWLKFTSSAGASCSKSEEAIKKPKIATITNNRAKRKEKKKTLFLVPIEMKDEANFFVSLHSELGPFQIISRIIEIRIEYKQ